MSPYPVHYMADSPPRFTRLQLAIRVVASIVLGAVGLSIGLVFLVAYLALPVFAAARLSGDRDPDAYLEEDGPKLLRGLHWFAAIYAWFGLVADKIPVRTPEEIVRIHVEPTGEPAPGSALSRVVLGLPSGIVLWLLGMVGTFVWLWSAIRILVQERVGPVAQSYLTGLQRWTIRLLAYQASLVEPYPPFSFEDAPPPPAGTEAKTDLRAA